MLQGPTCLRLEDAAKVLNVMPERLTFAIMATGLSPYEHDEQGRLLYPLVELMGALIACTERC